MTNQEIFNKVSQHLMTQGCQALDDLGRCCYRGLEGRKCAVGCLIPDDQYVRALEGKTVASAVIGSLLIRLGIDHTQHAILSDLQKIHDSGDVEHWSHMLRMVARKYSLECTL